MAIQNDSAHISYIDQYNKTTTIATKKYINKVIALFEKRLEYDKKNTILPAKPDYKRVEELVMEVNYHVCTARHSLTA